MKWINNFLRKLRWYDMSLLKLSVFFGTLFLVAAWPAFRNLALSIGWYWYLILMLVFATPLLNKLFLD